LWLFNTSDYSGCFVWHISSNVATFFSPRGVSTFPRRPENLVEAQFFRHRAFLSALRMASGIGKVDHGSYFSCSCACQRRSCTGSTLSGSIAGVLETSARHRPCGNIFLGRITDQCTFPCSSDHIVIGTTLTSQSPNVFSTASLACQ